MEQEHKPAILKGSLIYGAIVGLVSIVISFLLYFIDKTFETWAMILSVAIYLGMIVLALIMYKSEYGKGFISYGNTVLISFLIGLVASVITVVQTYAVYEFDESYLQDTKYYTIEKIDQQFDKVDLKYQDKLSDSQYEAFEKRLGEQREKQIDKVKNRTGFMFAFLGLFNSVFMAVIVGLITGIFIKKVQPQAPEIG